ncbi:MAG: hypothetical protein SGJ20_20565 [Planctomycetota bacterium]|nr:hypothetical protein [Planctomycetota bacterium]
MAKRVEKAEALGFLSVVEHEQHGLFGGFLVLNLAGRPLEFHCTAPIKPNRAQQILYGPTLQPYLYGEQIGATLAAKCSVELLAIFTDSPHALAVRNHTEVPVALVIVPKEQGGQSASGLSTFHFGENLLAVTVERHSDQELIVQRLELAGTMELFEPFGRIRAAIEEAQRGSRAA